jgi:hypothetical protein
MSQFFNKFPPVTYANAVAKNLLSRVNMSKLAFDSVQSFYTYTLKDGERPDNLSYDYYDNPDYVWLIGLSNQVIDPYYDIAVSDNNVDTLIIKKYGSMLNAQHRILFFENNYETDDSIISLSAYTAYPDARKKYWNPQYGYNNQIVGYVRKQEEWVVTTNQTNQITLASVTGTFLTDERLVQDEEIIATVDSFSGTAMTIKHVTNVAIANDYLNTEDNAYSLATEDMLNLVEESMVVTGETSGASAYIITNNITSQNIPADELIYWNAVTAYEYEHRLNHQKREIKLLDNRYSVAATKQLKTLLST